MGTLVHATREDPMAILTNKILGVQDSKVNEYIHNTSHKTKAPLVSMLTSIFSASDSVRGGGWTIEGVTDPVWLP